jgi:hypothetical protein
LQIFAFFKATFAACKDRDRRYQLMTVTSLPHATEQDQLVRRWLAWLLISRADEFSVPVRSFPTGLTPTHIGQIDLKESPPLDQLATLIRSKDGPLPVSQEMDDATFYQSTILLQMVLSHLWDDISSVDATKRDQLQDVRQALTKADSRISTFL